MKHRNFLSTKSYFINRFGKLSTSFLFYQMQDIAWEHANILGFGYNHLKEKNQFWVLSRILVKIYRLPVWAEDFTLETWSRGTDGFFGYRDFNFVDKEGQIIIQATSSWLVLDLNTKRIVRLSDFNNFPTYQESVFGENAGKIESPASSEIQVFTPVLFNEIDINQHFNTGRYIERIMDSYDFGFHEIHELAEFEINFLKEGMPSDCLAVKKQLIDETNHLCSVVRESNEVELIRARLVWKKKNDNK
jgi:medium-chain acyl-[acyl-carrier-protein] hydrolase